MHRILRLPIIVLIACGTPAAYAGAKDLFVSLDVPRDEAPSRVCVLTRYDYCASGKCSVTPVSELTANQIAGTNQYLLAASDSPNVKDRVKEVLQLLAQRPKITNRCDRSNQMCAPALELRDKGGPDDKTRYITCSGKDGSNERVAFLRFEFTNVKTDNPVVEVDLSGTTATLVFRSELDRSVNTIVGVIGGDFAPETTTHIGYTERLSVQLRPRCRRATTTLEGFPDGTYDVTANTDDARQPLHGGTCMAQVRDEAVALELPVTTEGEIKSIFAKGRAPLDFMNLIGASALPRVEATASWSTETPPSPLRLEARTFSFTWKPPIGCEAETWTDDPKWSPKHVEAAHAGEWSRSCPRATLFDGSPCKLAFEGAECEYVCTSPRHPLTFPTPVHFERLRLQGESDKVPQPVSIYSWIDSLVYSGQQLVSTVPVEDRHVMLELVPTAWEQRGGVQYNEIRLVSAEGALARTFIRRVAKRWEALRLPGRCIDRVTLAIFGSSTFEETPVDVVAGVVKLKSPQNYRRRGRVELELGSTLQAEAGVKDVKPAFGIGVLLSYESSFPVNFGLFGQGAVTWKTFTGIDAEKRSVVIARYGIGLVGDLWLWRGFHLYGRATVQGDSPIDTDNDGKLGIAENSSALEFGVLGEVSRRRIWLSLGSGINFDVEHNHFITSGLDEPTTRVESHNELFFVARMRMRLR